MLNASNATSLTSAEKVEPDTLRTVAIVSLLGEGPSCRSALRSFKGRTVLAITMDRLGRAEGVASTVVVAWGDQVELIRGIVPNIEIHSFGPRQKSRFLEETEASLRWADGWRGGLLGKTTFDRGFDAPAILSVLEARQCDAAVLIDPTAALIEPAMIDRLIDHLAALPDQKYAFAPGAVGSGAMLLRRAAIADLGKRKCGPGSLLDYHPDRPEHDPSAKSFALPAAPRIARSLKKISIDSTRQTKRLALVQAGDAESTIAQLEASGSLDELPREVIIELTTRRATRPAWSMLATTPIDRPDLSLDAAKSIFAQLATFDDTRVTFAGVGDPLLHPQWPEIVAAAEAAGLKALHIETDLLPDDATAVDALAASNVDIVSFHLPAAHAMTYARLMGTDRMRDVLENVKRLLLARSARDSGVPILVPTFVKCAANSGEMEAWYDQWLRALGAAVIVAPSDFSGRITYEGVADMTVARRRPCRRLKSRITILSDGTLASCEEDVKGEQRCGSASSIHHAWSDGLAMLRSLHDEHRWDESELCKTCRMWDRP